MTMMAVEKNESRHILTCRTSTFLSLSLSLYLCLCLSRSLCLCVSVSLPASLTLSISTSLLATFCVSQSPSAFLHLHLSSCFSVSIFVCDILCSLFHPPPCLLTRLLPLSLSFAHILREDKYEDKAFPDVVSHRYLSTGKRQWRK